MKKYLIVFLISMVPLIELRGAIPYAVGFDLPIVPSIIVALLGNMLPVPFIFLFARRFLVIYNLITFTDYFQWRAPRAISRGIFPHAARR